MKSYTDIEQSKRLTEILPIESADMHYSTWTILDGEFIVSQNQGDTIEDLREDYGNQIIPCWSLAALFEVLPNEISTDEKFINKYQIDIRKYDGESNTTWYQIAYGNDRGSSGEWHDMINTGEKENIVDCCFQMILKLKEMDLL